MFQQLGHIVVSFLLHIVREAHGCISTAAQGDTATARPKGDKTFESKTVTDIHVTSNITLAHSW